MPGVIVGGVEDHVHFLAGLSRTFSVADLIKELKRGSSLWIKEKEPTLREFAWQNGYGVFSIGFSRCKRFKRTLRSRRSIIVVFLFKMNSAAS